MLLILVGFTLLGLFCWMKKGEALEEDPPREKDSEYLMYGAITSWVVGAIYMIFICCCWKNISLGASIMEAASAFVTGNVRVIFLPITAYLVCIPFLAYWIVTASFLYTCGIPEYSATSPIPNIIWE